jgi:hypothetical protein
MVDDAKYCSLLFLSCRNMFVSCSHATITDHYRIVIRRPKSGPTYTHTWYSEKCLRWRRRSILFLQTPFGFSRWLDFRRAWYMRVRELFLPENPVKALTTEVVPSVFLRKRLEYQPISSTYCSTSFIALVFWTPNVLYGRRRPWVKPLDLKVIQIPRN